MARLQTTVLTMQLPRLNAGILRALLVMGIWSVAACRHPDETRHLETKPAVSSSPTYAGAERCAGCHAQAAAAWRHSHHAQAMEEANDSTVLGNFRNSRFTKDGITSSFYLKDGKHYVRTHGPDGKLTDYSIAYTFGVFPLQQYLVPFPNGRLQSLVLSWDSRSV